MRHCHLGRPCEENPAKIRKCSWSGSALASGGGRPALMTDYDGTLTPHVSEPTEGAAAHEVQHHLAVLARTRGVRLAVVSGRDLGDVTQRVAVSALCMRLPRTGHRRPRACFQPPPGRAQQRWCVRSANPGRRASSIQGMRVETKRFGRHRPLPSHERGGRRSFETELAGHPSEPRRAAQDLSRHQGHLELASSRVEQRPLRFADTGMGAELAPPAGALRLHRRRLDG